MNDSFEAVPARRIVVTTPEQVELRFETAGIGSRIGAQLIDTLILLLINVALFLAWILIVEAMPAAAAAWMDEYAAAVAILVFAVLNGGYFLIGEYATGGRTVGKRAMGIRVMQDNGRPLSFLASVIRNLLRVIDQLPLLYVVGAICSFFHPHDKRLGDLAAGTVVVYDAGGAKRRSKRMEKRLASWAPYLPELNLQPWARERVSEEEWALVSGFAERLPFLAASRAEELARGIAERLAPKLELGERWTEAIEAENAAKEALRAGAQPQRPSAGEAGEAGEAAGDAPKTQPPALRGRPTAILWALAMYISLRQDWEFLSEVPGGEA